MPAGAQDRARGSAALDVVELIGCKRDGGELSEGEIAALVHGYVAGSIPDYQMSALLMAIVFRGLTLAETFALTRAMVDSGERVDLSSIGRRIVDKHSTGGVGDKVSLALGPIVAACGVPFAKMSGRGLGHTGGTLDKLESIPGFTVELSQQQFLRQVRDIGIAIVGQTANVVPADKQLYALRDVTGTVQSIPLIAASIMSKKVAAGADAIVLDVKVGSGAFMKSLDDARVLADTMLAIGEVEGREVRVLLTDMNAPLGQAVGNALEIEEVVRLLQGEGPEHLRELVTCAAGVLLSLSDLGVDEEQGGQLAREAVRSGAAFAKWRDWICAQGGDPDAELPRAPVQHTVVSGSSGTVTQMDALTVGVAAARLGAGRATKDDHIDHAVGVQLCAGVGSTVAAGEALCVVHARSEEAAREAARVIVGCTTIADQVGDHRSRPIVIERRP